MRRILKFSLLVGWMLFNTAIYVGGQEKRRIVQDLYLPKDAPVQIIGRELEGKKLDAENSGAGRADWIKYLTLDVKNVSKKNISFVEITLTVPRQGQMPGPVRYWVIFGSMEDKGISGIISPGEVAKIQVGDHDVLFWENRLKDWGVADFDRVELQLRKIYFDDGTGWSLGRDIVQDKRNRQNGANQLLNSLRCLLGDLLQPIRQDAGFFCGKEIPRRGSVHGWKTTQMRLTAKVAATE